MGSNMSLYEWTAVGLKYIAVLGILGALTAYYQSSSRGRRGNRLRSQRPPPNMVLPAEPSNPAESRILRERRREKRRDTVVDAPSGDNSSTGKARTTSYAAEDESRDSDMADLAFANELANLKKGSTLAAPSKTDARQKTVRQSTANKHADLSATSFTGAEADDDMSPSASPSLQARTLPTGADVSDMLEAPGTTPSVLRLTGPNKPTNPKQNEQQRSAQAQETKKQRQNKKKAEERKQLREQGEEERRVMLEKQRRTAREARGEPAKNGVPAKVPATNAWDKVNGAGAVRAPAVESQLLDTFVEPASNVLSEGPASATSSSASEHVWEHGLPDEDEQLRRILESDDSTWNTVPTGKRNRRKQGPNGNHPAGANGTDGGDHAANGAAPAVRQPVLFEQEA